MTYIAEKIPETSIRRCLKANEDLEKQDMQYKYVLKARKEEWHSHIS